MVGPPTSPTNLSSASDTEISAADAGQSCCCDSCSERRLFLSVRLTWLMFMYFMFLLLVTVQVIAWKDLSLSLSLTHTHCCA